MADNDWQLEAVHEQFDVFDKLAEPCSSFAATELGKIVRKVDAVIKQHFRTNKNQTRSSRYISAELIKSLPDEENNIHISFVVVVTNEYVKGNLCKIPVFRALVSGSQHKFVDTSGSVYGSWDAFMKNNDLPDCKFCYPVNGCYNVGERLKIDFALSPLASRSQRKIWLFGGGFVVVAAVLAATFFFNVAPLAYKLASQLIPLAEQILPTIVNLILKYIKEVLLLQKQFQNGEKNVVELLLPVFNLLRSFYSTFKEDIFDSWKEIKKVLSSAYNYLSRMFAKYFKKASNETQHRFVASVVRVEKEMSEAQEEAGAQLHEMNRNQRSTESTKSTSTVMVYNSLSYNQQIFQNCKNESALLNEIKNHNDNQVNCTQSLPFTPTTKKLLTLTQTVADQSGEETLRDVKDVFESLSCIVKDEYNNKINNYVKGVNAAKAVGGNGINLDDYNKYLGIIGDPKEHFMNEAIESVQEDRLVFRLKEKVKEFRMDTKIYLIPMYKNSEDDDIIGVYKTIRARKKNKFSAQELVRVLKESFVVLKDSALVWNENNDIIYIRSEEFSIFAYQEVNEENTSEGVLFINRN